MSVKHSDRFCMSFGSVSMSYGLEMLRRRKELTLSLAGLILCVTSWSLASAPWSNDDFGYHVVNVWCVDGFDDGSCLQSSDSEFLIPKYYPIPCYFKQLERPARCRTETANQESRFSTLDSNYRWLHMWTMHRFVGEGGETSVLRMRLFNGGLFVLLVGLMLIGPAPRIAKAGFIGIALSLVPVGLWYVTSMSPTGWTITAASTGWSFAAALAQMMRTPNKVDRVAYRQLACMVGLVLGFITAYGSRQDGAVMFTVVVLAALISERNAVPRIAGKSRRAIPRKPTLVLAAAIIILVAPKFFSYASGFINPNLPVLDPSQRGEAILWFSNWLFHYPYLFMAALGAEPIGSQELLRVPAVAWLISMLVLGQVIMRALERPSKRQLASLIPLALGFVAALWFAGREFDLYNVPPRYVLPLLPPILGIMMNSSNAEESRLGFSSRSRLTLGVLALGHALCLFVVLERYTAGYSGGIRPIPVRFDERWFDWPIGPNFILFCGSLGWWMFLVYALRYIENRSTRSNVPMNADVNA